MALFRGVTRRERLQTEALVGNFRGLLAISVLSRLIGPSVCVEAGVESEVCALGVWDDATAAALICSSSHTWPVRNLRLLIIHL